MEYNPVSIESNYRTNEFRSFTVTCYSHHVTTIVTAKASVVRDWLYHIRRIHIHRILRGRLVVGLGVQWRSNSISGQLNPPATLQLCVGHQCLIFQLLYSPSTPRSLIRFLSDPSISFVGVSVQNDNYLLQQSQHNLSVSRLIELRHVANKYRGSPKRVSMETLAATILGLHGITKTGWVGDSYWDVCLLREDQVEYACIDAFISFLMGKDLQVWGWDNNYTNNIGYISD